MQTEEITSGLCLFHCDGYPFLLELILKSHILFIKRYITRLYPLTLAASHFISQHELSDPPLPLF